MPEQTREKLLEVKDLHVVFGKGKRAFDLLFRYISGCWRPFVLFITVAAAS